MDWCEANGDASVGQPEHTCLDHVSWMGRERVVDNVLGTLACGLPKGRGSSSSLRVEPPKIERPVHPCSLVTPSRVRAALTRTEARPAGKDSIMGLAALMPRLVHQRFCPARHVLRVETTEVKLNVSPRRVSYVCAITTHRAEVADLVAHITAAPVQTAAAPVLVHVIVG